MPAAKWRVEQALRSSDRGPLDPTWASSRIRGAVPDAHRVLDSLRPVEGTEVVDFAGWEEHASPSAQACARGRGRPRRAESAINAFSRWGTELRSLLDGSGEPEPSEVKETCGPCPALRRPAAQFRQYVRG